MSANKDFCKVLVDFSNSVKVLENCFREISKNIEEIKLMGSKSIEIDLEKEQYVSELNKIKLSEFNKKANEFGKVILSKLEYESLLEDLKNYELKIEDKVKDKVKKIQDDLQSQLDNKLSSQKILSEKQILEIKLDLAEEKLDYICRLNKFEHFKDSKCNKKVSFTDPIVEEKEENEENEDENE